jgi:hypothetical protein
MKELRMNIRFAHFRDWDDNGRLVATIATTVLNDGRIAVGVSRCADGDIPNRKTGRCIAEARLRQYLSVLSGESHNGFRKNQLDLLAYTIPRDAFIRLIIKGKFYVLLANSGRERRMALMDMLRDAVYHIEAV